jgi:hypothetical protein
MLNCLLVLVSRQNWMMQGKETCGKSCILGYIPSNRRKHANPRRNGDVNLRYNYDDGAGFCGTPQKPAEGSFWDCFHGSGLAKTHIKGQYAEGKLFNKAAADLLLSINNAEGASLPLLAVTLMNENTTFNLMLKPNTNGSSKTEWWDVGPFQINQHYTNKAIANGEVKNEGNSFLAYWDMFGPVVKEDEPFTGSPLANGQMAARRLQASGSNDRQRAINYAQRAGRGASYDSFAPLFDKFFNCYKGN